MSQTKARLRSQFHTLLVANGVASAETLADQLANIAKPKTRQPTPMQEQQPRKVDAVSEFFSNGGKGLSKESQEALLETPITDYQLWGKIVRAYCLMGWNPRNVLGMYEFYKRGEIPSSNQPQRRKDLSHARLETGNTVSDEGREFAERLAARSKTNI